MFGPIVGVVAAIVVWMSARQIPHAPPSYEGIAAVFMAGFAIDPEPTATENTKSQSLCVLRGCELGVLGG